MPLTLSITRRWCKDSETGLNGVYEIAFVFGYFVTLALQFVQDCTVFFTVEQYDYAASNYSNEIY